MARWRSWGEVFRFYLNVKGYDHGYAAFMADRWEARRTRKKRAAVRGER
jgi:hypothetical protein